MPDAQLPRIVVLASGGGTNLQALIESVSTGALAVRIALVVSDQPDAGALRRAAAAGIPTRLLSLPDLRNPTVRLAYDRQLADTVAAAAPDLVVLAGWMLLLSPTFLDRFPHQVINIHPALLPDDGGATVATSLGSLPALRGHRAVREALARRLPITGTTVHWVTVDVDGGPPILREEVAIRPSDDEAALHERIKDVEHRLLPQAVAMVLAHQATESAGQHAGTLTRTGTTGGKSDTTAGGKHDSGGDRPRLEVRSEAR